MANVPKQDYEKIVNIFNESGEKIAIDYIQQNYGIKAPRGVISRIKQSPEYSYDKENRKIIKSSKQDESIFMGLDELCSKGITPMDPVTPVLSTRSNDILELLFRDLMQEKLLELNKYITLNRYSATIEIDKQALVKDGYQININ
ncbi:hypothetical protein SAMN05660462_01324 [Proteiniborus ethanoligenes]|uniref:Uncharacterized protein n=1 Tax=Proteiniborus ethanoligenes TaxID=415015 RepID=A0A1H3P0U4_9FIRM|nr:hypothetical protein [Proteiniborus ethanoligenes]SDY94764.1 hypothetical protein SAMN05660462_01324 [Proteiniborus ethanoligenes]